MNHRWLFVLILLFSVSMAACQPVQAEPAAQSRAATSALTADEEANKAVANRVYEEIMNQRNLAAAAELFAPDMVAHQSEFDPAGWMDLGELIMALPDLQVTVEQMQVEGAMVTALVSFSGTHEVEFMGVAPSGNPVAFTLIDLLRIDDGKIAEVWHNVPLRYILEQMGAPASASAPAEPAQEEANRAVAQRLYDEVFSQKNLSFFEEAMNVPILANHELDFGGDGLDPALLTAGFPDLQATVERTVAEGDMVGVAQVTFSGTHQGEFLGVAPTGKPMTFAIIDIFRFEDGKIVEVWHYVPVADILEQISDPPAQ